MGRLSNPASFWINPTAGNQSESWIQWYGTFDTIDYPSPVGTPSDFGSEPEPADDGSEETRDITLSPYSWNPTASERGGQAATITSVYSADLSNNAHRLHDAMIRLIANVCSKHRLAVFSDPNSLDLLVEFDDVDLLIEAKSATARNLAQKIRMGLGQITYYDFLRSKQSNKPTRRGLALPLEIQSGHWSVDFLPRYLDVDLITLRNGRLLTYSSSDKVSEVIS